MKPFEKGKTYKDTDGHDVTILDDNHNGALLGSSTDFRGHKYLITYDKDGKSHACLEKSLVQENTKIDGWAVVWCRDGKCWFGNIYKNENTARRITGAGTYGEVVDVVKIEWEG